MKRKDLIMVFEWNNCLMINAYMKRIGFKLNTDPSLYCDFERVIGDH